MDACADHLAAYYDGGGTNAAEPARALRAVGYRGTNTTVRRALALLRGRRPRAALGVDASPPTNRAAVWVPSPRQVAWLLRKGEAQLTDDERVYRTALEEACPALAEARTLGDRFVRMVHARDPNDLGPWLAAAAPTDLRRFAAGI